MLQRLNPYVPTSLKAASRSPSRQFEAPSPQPDTRKPDGRFEHRSEAGSQGKEHECLPGARKGLALGFEVRSLLVPISGG